MNGNGNYICKLTIIIRDNKLRDFTIWECSQISTYLLF